MPDDPFASLPISKKRKKPGIFDDVTGGASSASAEDDPFAKLPVQQRKKPSAWAFLAPIASGLTLGASDEILGGIEGLSNLGKQGGFSEGYERGKAKVRGVGKDYAEAHPILSPALELAGGIAAPGFGAARFAAGKVGKSALAGAGLGAASGAAYGDEGHRVSGATVGAGVGGVLGGGAVAGGKLLGGIANQLGWRSAKASEKIGVQKAIEALRRDKITPEMLGQSEADALSTDTPLRLFDMGGQNTSGLARAAQAVPSRARDELPEILHGRHAGQPERIFSQAESAMDVKGRDLHEVAQEVMTQAKVKAKPLYEAAYAGAPINDEKVIETLQLPTFKAAYKRGQRIAQAEGVELPAIPTKAEVQQGVSGSAPSRYASGGLKKNLKNVDNDSLMDEYVNLANQLERENGKSIYNFTPDDNFHTTTDGRSVMNATIFKRGGKYVSAQAEAIQRAKQTLGAMNRVELELQRRGLRIEDAFEQAGRKANDVGGEVDDSFAFGKLDPANDIPVQLIDYMKRGMDDLIESKMRGGTMGRTEARALRSRLKEVLSVADEQVPAYAEARKTWAGDMAHSKALEMGSRVFGKSKKPQASIEKRLAVMSDSEKEMFKIGTLGAVRDILQGAGDNTDKVRRLLGSPKARDAVQAVIGDLPKSAQFSKAMGLESKAVQSKNFILGNSQTARILADMDDMTNAAIGMLGDAATGNVAGVARRGLGAFIGNRKKAGAGKIAESVNRTLQAQPGTPEFKALVERLRGMKNTGSELPLDRVINAKLNLVPGSWRLLPQLKNRMGAIGDQPKFPAVRGPDGKIHFSGETSHSGIVQELAREGKISPSDRKYYGDLEGSAFGFLDSGGDFLTRTQAQQRAVELGIKPTNPHGFGSEDLPDVMASSDARWRQGRIRPVVNSKGYAAAKMLGGILGAGSLGASLPLLANGQQGQKQRETTTLPKEKEAAFRLWLKRNHVTDLDDPRSFYDYRGAFLAGVNREPGEEGHFPDTFKQHGHPTFSVESKYSKDSTDGGRWEGERLIPSPKSRLQQMKRVGNRGDRQPTRVR